MHWLLILYIGLNFFAAALCTAIAFLVPQKTAQVDWGFRGFSLMTALWCATSGLFFLNDSVTDFWVWTGIQLIAYVSVPVLWFYFIVQFLQKPAPPAWRLFIIPLATLVIYWTPISSSLLWAVSQREIQLGIAIAEYERGLWFNFVHLPYSYGILFLGHAYLFSSIWQGRREQRRQLFILLGCGVTPLLLNFLTLSPIYASFSFFDLTPTGLALSAILFCWGLSRFQILERSPLAYQQIFTSLKTSVLVLDLDFQIIEFNAAAESLLDSAAALGKSAKKLIPFLYDADWQRLQTKGEIEVQVGQNYFHCDQQPILSKNNKALGYVLTIADVTRSRQLQEQILQGALLYDALTGLPNRTLFADRLTQALKSEHFSDRSLAIAFLDVDRFKVINDSLGHHVGDSVLKEIASRLQTHLNPMDTVARLGGDEFAILTFNTSPSEIESLCLQLQQTIQAPIVLEKEHTVNTSASIGIAYGASELSVEQLLKHADIAMYQAKSSSHGSFAIFEQSLAKQTVHRMALEVALRQAIENEEFFLLFQPIVNIANNKISSFEALIRWQNTEYGLISPTVFIPIAEEMGLIPALDRWVLQQSCQQIRDWNTFYPHLNLKISVNLSTANFVFSNLAETITQVLQETQLSGKHLKLEITESILMKNIEATASILQKLAMQGIKVWLDDFGTGHSSLSYLHRLPLAGLKIDRSFVHDAQYSPQSVEIITTIISLAHRLDLELVAEGIETEEQRQMLESFGCELGQGYLWWKPMTKADATKALSQQSRQVDNKAAYSSGVKDVNDLTNPKSSMT